MEHIHLNNQQAINLLLFGYTFINNVKMFKIKRFDSRLEADKNRQPGEITAETKTAAFILSTEQSESLVCKSVMAF